MSPVHKQETAQDSFSQRCEEAFHPVGEGLERWSAEIRYVMWNVNGQLYRYTQFRVHEIQDKLDMFLDPKNGPEFHRHLSIGLTATIKYFRDAYEKAKLPIEESAYADVMEQLEELRHRFDQVLKNMRVPRFSLN